MEYARAAAIIAVTTAVAAAVRAVFHVPDVVMLFLLGVMIVAVTSSRRAALLASALAVLSYDFFFVPPPFSFDVSEARYLLTFAMMFGVSVVIGTLALRLREQQQAALERERSTAALYALSRELGRAVDAPGVAAACVVAARDALDAEAILLVRAERDELVPLAAAPAEARLAGEELAAARWVLEHGAAAGPGTETLLGQGVVFVPLRTFGDVLGVLAIRPAARRGLEGRRRTFLDAFALQVSLALDRVRLADEARAAALRAKTEELRSALLSTVSHDLRTPLAAITGSATTLRDDGALDAATRRDLVEAICEEAERLERLVTNLLDMTRLESGAVEPRREWVPLVEVIGAALTRLERPLAGHPVTTAIPDDLPLVALDPVLVQHLFVNLLENAAKYTPVASEIELRAAVDEGALTVDVADRGPGIPPGDEERIFERFHRVARSGPGGVGLGLAIARAIASAHGGRLVAANRPGGGAVFRLTLPLAPSPPCEAPGAERAAS